MKFSEKWLREWVNPQLSTQALADQLSMAGLETDALLPVAGSFQQVIIGQIEEAVQHPKADRLRVCQVNVGNQPYLNIVCGAPNARAGIKVAVAMIGAVLPNGIEIKRAKLRDVESEGMLCSAQELGIPELSEGIIELPEDAPLGMDIREYLDLDDTIIDLSITPNRGDCLSILGIAREVAALNHCAINEPVILPITETIQDTQTVMIDAPEGCGNYIGRIIKNVKANALAPRSLTDRVKRSGTRSISAIVDITNYVLYELGQPLHAFDSDKIQGNITVRLSKAGETIELLDGQTITLKAGVVLITDEAGPIAMAGIMGGLRTAVTSETKNIFLESAWFEPTMIAGKARQYNLSTDAAYRFERGVDPTIQQKALSRAVNLIVSICGGDVGPESSGKIPHSPTLKKVKNIIISLNLKSIERILGIVLDHDEKENIKKSFFALGLALSNTSDAAIWEIQIPSHRSDITIEADLIEEVARIYGYQRIPTLPLNTTLTTHTIPENKVSIETFCETLVALGYHETINYSFVNKEKQAQLYPEGESITLLNPISSEYSDMRKGLWLGLLESAVYNQNRQMNDFCLFEQASSFEIQNGQVIQKNKLAGLCIGNRVNLHWNEPTRPYDFYDVKGDVETLLSLSHLHKNNYYFKSANHPALHPGQTAEIISHDEHLGFIGALHPEWAKQWDIQGPVFLFELDLEKLAQTSIPEHQKLSKFPAIRRDLSFVIDAQISGQSILDCMNAQDKSILRQAHIFDLYQGENIAKNQKSIAVALILQHPERTLIESEVNELIEKIISALEKAFSVTLRQ